MKTGDRVRLLAGPRRGAATIEGTLAHNGYPDVLVLREDGRNHVVHLHKRWVEPLTD